MTLAEDGLLNQKSRGFRQKTVENQQQHAMSAPVAGQHWCKRRDIATAEHERRTDDSENHRASLSSTKAIVLSKSIHDP
jgi:hypothetical protein